ncbi:MAG: histidine triad nucleotide-binding protein [Spirochaetaceae bacterium]|jgi:histidine triad (HIT) family protein|nr:histidine triad nucleotide-binding protein [Spirochaetaceae bacterium]GMO27899.1 MAG: histidine triad nucleotide-binding protein [Termitinemataceae bacterium]
MDCLFCNIAAGKIASRKIYEDEELFAFHDINPQSPVHFLVIPKKHIANLMECNAEDASLLGKMLDCAQRLAVQQGLGERGCRFVINCKSDGLQTIDHLHIHVLGGRKLKWPPG